MYARTMPPSATRKIRANAGSHGAGKWGQAGRGVDGGKRIAPGAIALGASRASIRADSRVSGVPIYIYDIYMGDYN